jgi:hypothetical protein
MNGKEYKYFFSICNKYIKPRNAIQLQPVIIRDVVAVLFLFIQFNCKYQLNLLTEEFFKSTCVVSTNSSNIESDE